MRITQRLRAAFKAAGPEAQALAYLNEATSIADLERRHREIDSGRFRPSRFPY